MSTEHHNVIPPHRTFAFCCETFGKHFILDLVTYTGLSTKCGDQSVLCGSRAGIVRTFICNLMFLDVLLLFVCSERLNPNAVLKKSAA